MCTLPLLAVENVTAQFVVPTVAAAVDVVVHLDLDRRGRRAVREIVAVTGRVEAGVVETATLFSSTGETLVRRAGLPPHEERFMRAGYDLASLLGDPTAA
jgi:pilus assembly protein CpaF